MTGGDWNCILHVGAGKCGSSSLQACLSRTPLIRGRDGRHAYCAIGPEGQVLSGRALTRAALRSPFGFVASTDFRSHRDMPGSFLAAAPALRRILWTGRRPILSCEGWNFRGPEFARHDLLRRMGLRARVVLFVRPPLDWLNSAWWQWPAWSRTHVDDWVGKNLFMVDWARQIEEWQAVPGVQRVDVHLATRDVVSCFYRLLGAPAPDSVRVNGSVPAAVLRFLQRNRQEFRPDPHSSQIEFVLSRRVDFGALDPAPWILPRPLQASVLAAMAPSVARLATHLDPAEADELHADPRWHSAEAYADRPVEPVGPPEDAGGQDALIAALIRAIAAMDARDLERLSPIWSRGRLPDRLGRLLGRLPV